MNCTQQTRKRSQSLLQCPGLIEESLLDELVQLDALVGQHGRQREDAP